MIRLAVEAVAGLAMMIASFVGEPAEAAEVVLRVGIHLLGAALLAFAFASFMGWPL